MATWSAPWAAVRQAEPLSVSGRGQQAGWPTVGAQRPAQCSVWGSAGDCSPRAPSSQSITCERRGACTQLNICSSSLQCIYMLSLIGHEPAPALPLRPLIHLPLQLLPCTRGPSDPSLPSPSTSPTHSPLPIPLNTAAMRNLTSATVNPPIHLRTTPRISPSAVPSPLASTSLSPPIHLTPASSIMRVTTTSLSLSPTPATSTASIRCGCSSSRVDGLRSTRRRQQQQRQPMSGDGGQQRAEDGGEAGGGGVRGTAVSRGRGRRGER